MHCLVTGGLGFIGSHTVVQLLDNGYNITIIDNLSNSKEECLDQIKQLCPNFIDNVVFYKIDLLDKDRLDKIIHDIQTTNSHPIDSCIHFAGLKAVGESVIKPLLYYQNNIVGTLNLLEILAKNNINRLIFSSSATVYGEAKYLSEDSITGVGITNPYGKTKYMIEEIIKDYCKFNSLKCVILRYFNPVGAHLSGRIGEDPNGIPNNLTPYVAKVAVGRRPSVRVWGNDYPTPDGTGIRDYIHIMDLASGHIKALEKLQHNPGVVTYNLGTGRGYSVMEVIREFERACQHEIPYQVMDRRPGDAAISYADPTKANQELNWYAQKSLEDMIQDAWRWQLQNPEGYP